MDGVNLHGVTMDPGIQVRTTFHRKLPVQPLLCVIQFEFIDWIS